MKEKEWREVGEEEEKMVRVKKRKGEERQATEERKERKEEEREKNEVGGNGGGEGESRVWKGRGKKGWSKGRGEGRGGRDGKDKEQRCGKIKEEEGKKGRRESLGKTLGKGRWAKERMSDRKERKTTYFHHSAQQYLPHCSSASILLHLKHYFLPTKNDKTLSFIFSVAETSLIIFIFK